MLKLRKTAPGEPLVVSMTGLRLGDRVLIVGGGELRTIVLLAGKPGLTGRTAIVDETPERTARAADAAQREGALVDSETAPLSMLPFDAASFDVGVVNHVLPGLPEERRIACLREVVRVLRPGGRCVVIEAAQRGGLAGLLGRGAAIGPGDVESAMQQAGFGAVRTLAQRDGMLFVEGGRRK